jgi:hypothetical protein
MSTDSKTEIASDTIKTANAKLTLDNAHLTSVNTQLAEENKALRTQLELSNSIIENDLKADLIMKIQAASDYPQIKTRSNHRTIQIYPCRKRLSRQQINCRQPLPKNKRRNTKDGRRLLDATRLRPRNDTERHLVRWTTRNARNGS